MKNAIRFTVIVAVLVMLLCAGCSKKAVEQGEKPVDESAANELTIFSWWTAGGEAEGLAELVKLFKAKNPNVEITNAAVAGGAGTNAKAVLKTRMLGGDPPGTFQVHGGAELIQTWVKAGMLEPVDPVIDDPSVYPKQLLEMVRDGDYLYAVPANVHRGNVLWYNKKVLDEHQINPPVTFEQWIAACEKLKAAGVTPLALASRNKWPVTHLFENMLGAFGSGLFYRDLMNGKFAWTEQSVKDALGGMKKLLPYVNSDHSALTWDQACAMVLSGKAAMTVMGDWAKGFFLANGAQPGVDFGAVPTPGTAGKFFVITDTFCLPKGAPNKEGTLEFLKVVASKEGQIAFNLKKGSIPARTDASIEKFDIIAKTSIFDFARDELIPSCAHGSATSEGMVTAINDQMSVFIAGDSVESTAKALEAAAIDAGVRKGE
jgi:glucose/mannose transport system substrate-binding protein